MCSHRGWLLLLPRHIVVVIVVFGVVLLTPHDECRGNLLQDLKDDRTEAERNGAKQEKRWRFISQATEPRSATACGRPIFSLARPNGKTEPKNLGVITLQSL